MWAQVQGFVPTQPTTSRPMLASYFAECFTICFKVDAVDADRIHTSPSSPTRRRPQQDTMEKQHIGATDVLFV